MNDQIQTNTEVLILDPSSVPYAEQRIELIQEESARAAMTPIVKEPPAAPDLRRGTIRVVFRAPSRNAPCPCGGGKKFKNCHGAHPSCRAK